MAEAEVTASVGPVASAAWLGLLTALSPCPLAANLATVAYLGRRVGAPRAALWQGLVYAAGRAATSAALGAAVAGGLLAAGGLAFWSQRWMHHGLSLVFAVTGGILLARPAWWPAGGGDDERRSRLAARGGAGAAFTLGAISAAAFCPVSAALFFGSLIPLAIGEGAVVRLTMVYGLTTGLPVAGLAGALAGSVHIAARLFRVLGAVERWAAPITGGGLVVYGMGAFVIGW